MRFTTGLWFLSLFVFASCGSDESSAGPAREQVELLLQQEAEAMKREGEADVNPALGVKVTWTIQGVEVRPQEGNDVEPWAGTIQFLIQSETPDLDGVATERFERSYDYGFDLESERWLMH